LIVSADDGAGSPGLWTLEATGGSPTMIADRVVGGFDLVPTH
jgi:hypothetical protein